ncbi:hypothetical protein BDC45DRAFT_565124 [Circinella umbellata]|nr:hypothetical protein BDC45DRAFT_565124 [Circinella umbellata]
MTDNHESSSYSPVLAHGTDHSLSYKPKLIDFCGYEGEDFRHFRDTLESYFAIANIKDCERQASILNAQVKKYARIFLQAKVRKHHAIGGKYTELIKLLEEEYVTPDVIEYYKDAFEQIIQGEDEPPRMFLGRIQQAADLAELIGQHGTTLYPQDNPFIPQKTEDRIPSTWYKNKQHSNKIIQQAKTHAFHSPNLNQPSGDKSPSIDILTSKMKNLELYQHEAAVPPSHYEKHPNGLEQMIWRVVQEETRKASPSYNRSNDYHNSNYGPPYRSNHYPNNRNNYRGYNSRYPNDKNENNYQAENSYRNTEYQRNKYNYDQNNEHNRPQEYHRPTDYQRPTDYPPRRPNNNNNNTPSVDEELFAAQPPSSHKTIRQLRPRNETDKVQKNENTQKKVDFKDPPVRRKSKNKRQATSQQIVHMPPLSHDPGNNDFSAQPTFGNINKNNVNLSTSQNTKPTTDFQSAFGKTAFSNQPTSAWNPPTRPSTPEGNQWTQLRSNVDDMEISTPPSEKEADIIPMEPKPKQLTYNIGSDILNRNAEISFGQLLKVAPSLCRQFTKACKTARSLNVLDDASNRRSPNTTALYAEFYINKTPIRCLVDSGASRTCILKRYLS